MFVPKDENTLKNNILNHNYLFIPDYEYQAIAYKEKRTNMTREGKE